MTKYKHTKEARLKIKEHNARYWLGKKRSPETVEKIRKANLGYKHINRKKPTFLKPHPGWIKKGQHFNKKTEFKKGQRASPKTEFKKGTRLGKDNPAWKGGITVGIHLLRKSDEYKKWRLAVYKKYNYTCWECGKRGGKLEAHHIFSFTDFVDLRFRIENGIVLCQSCHSKIKTKEKERAWLIKYFRLRDPEIGVVEI